MIVWFGITNCGIGPGVEFQVRVTVYGIVYVTVMSAIAVGFVVGP